MNKIKSLTLVTLLAVAAASCKKDKNTDQLTGDVTELGQGAYVKLTKTNNAVVDFTNIAGTTLSINVDVLGKKSDSVVTYASTDGSSDITKWRRIKATVVTDNKAVISVTATQLANALGVNPVTLFQPGLKFTMYNEVFTSEKQRFSVLNTNSEFVSNGNYSQGFFWKATVGCPFSPVGLTGTWRVVSDADWVDFYPGEGIPVIAGGDSVSFGGYPRSNPLPTPSFDGPYGVRTRNTLIKINVASGEATIGTVSSGTGNIDGIIPITTGGYFPTGSSVPSIVARVSGTGFVFACTKTMDMSITVTYGSSIYRGNQFVMRLP